jgi:hypothetical protein
MFANELKSKNRFGPFFAAGLSPFDNSAVGTQAGPGINGMGADMDQYSQLLGTSLTSRRANVADDKAKQEKRKRAKRANEIFRTMSNGAGLHPFFFDKFLVWSDYVEGNLSEEDFTERVREEVNAKAALLSN